MTIESSKNEHSFLSNKDEKEEIINQVSKLAVLDSKAVKDMSCDGGTVVESMPNELIDCCVQYKN